MAKELKAQEPVQPAAPAPLETPATEPAAPAQPAGGGQEPVQEAQPVTPPAEQYDEIPGERYQELLDIEKRHKETTRLYGQTTNEVGVLRERVRQLEAQQARPTQTTPTQTVIPDDLRLKDEDLEDTSRFVGKVNRTFEHLATRQPSSPAGLSRDEVRLILLQEKAAEVIESDPVLSSMGSDEQGIPRALGLIDQAAAWAMAQNQQAGRIIYRDPKSAWEGFKKVLAGASPEPTMTAQEARKVIVKALKQTGTPSVPVGPSGPTSSIVEKYKGLLKTENNKEISAFYNKLSDADKKKIDLAVAQMNEEP